MWVTRPGLSPVMVGRAAELGELRRLLDGLTEPRIALISGEAGVGKSRLLREFAASVPAGTAVLGAAAQEGELNRPFDLLRDAAEPLVSAWEGVPDALAPRAHALGHVLAPLLPVPAHDDGHEHAGEELQRAAIELIRNLAGGRPLVLAFEDLHWADAASVALVGRLAVTPDLPVLLVGTFRPEDFDRSHPLSALLVELERQRTFFHLALSRLAPHDLRMLLEAVYGRAPSPDTVAALHRRTNGNPFFVEELIANAGGDPEALAGVSLPWNAAEAVLRRVDGLDPDERAVVDAAAVLATRVPFDLLAAVCDLDENRLIAVLRRLLDSGLLVEADADTFSFRHALAREAVADQLLGRQRRRLHEKALEALASAEETDDAVLAHHAAGAGRHDAVVRHARAAAERLLRDGVGQQAIRVAELGLTSAEQRGGQPDADELALRSVATRAAMTVGLYDLAARHAEQWRVLAVEAGSLADEAAALRHLALPRFHADDVAGYWRLLDRALAVAERLGPSAELAWCFAYRSQAHLFTDAFPDAVDWADRAIAVAEEADAPDVGTYALVNKGTALCSMTESAARGADLLRQAIVQAREINDIVSLCRAYSNLLGHYVHQGNGREGFKVAGVGWDMADRRGLTACTSVIAGLAVELSVISGDGDAARHWLERARRSGGPAGHLSWVRALDGWVRLHSGDVDGAKQQLRALRDDAERGVPRTAVLVVDLGTQIAAVTGDASETSRYLADLEAAVGPDPGTAYRHAVFGAGTAIVEAGGDVEAVRDLIDRTGVAEYDDVAGWVAHLRALEAEQRGDVAAAVAAYRESIDAWQAWRWAPTVAGLHARLARCLEILGKGAEALRVAHAGRDILASMPGPRRNELDAIIRRLSADAGDDRLLTPRESEVVRLLAEGLTNRQIAERLYISVKTAAVHVSNILAKTGLSTRTEVAAWAHRSGLATP